MSAIKARIERNLRLIRQNVEAACAKANRRPEDVSLVAVTKGADPEAIKALVELGHSDLGESRVQQLLARAAELEAWLERRRAAGQPAQVRWHMVGHLQRNKVRNVLDVAAVIHSVDSLRLAEEINAHAGRLGRKVDVFLQVNCSQEAQKFGVAVGAATHLCDLVSTLPDLRLVGLMTLAPLTADPEQARPSFTRLRELFEEMRHDRIGGEAFAHLSMGMSNDYIVAVEEGATVLRIGTAVFA